MKNGPLFLCLVRLLNYLGYGQGNLEENFSKLNHSGTTWHLGDVGDITEAMNDYNKHRGTTKNRSYSAHFSTLSGMLELTIARSNTAE